MTQPIIPWPGGKRRLAKAILPLLGAHQTYIEPFAGGAAIFFLKEPSRAEVLNDFNGELINLYRVVQHHLEEFVRQFRWALVSRQIFKWLQLQAPVTLTDIQRAARFYYLQRSAFGAKVAGQTFGVDAGRAPRLNLLRIEEELSEAHLRLSRVTLENLPWQQLVDRYDRPGAVFFCDPPYWQLAGYGTQFGWPEYQALEQRMGRIKGRMILTINDHPDIRELFKNWPVQTAKITYTCGSTKPQSKSTELIYTNWKPKAAK